MEHWPLPSDVVVPYDHGLGLKTQSLVQTKTRIEVVLTMSIHQCCTLVNIHLCFIDGFDVFIEISLAKEPTPKDATYSDTSANLQNSRRINRLAEHWSKYDFAFEKYSMMAAYKRTRALSNSAAATDPVKGYSASTVAQRNIDSTIDAIPSTIKANFSWSFTAIFSHLSYPLVLYLPVLTCNINRTPAQGSAAWTGSNCTAISPASLKRLIHLIAFSKRSLMITVSPLFRVYRHLLSIHFCLDVSASSDRLCTTLRLSGQLKLMLRLSSSLSLVAAIAQMSFLIEQLAISSLSSRIFQNTNVLGRGPVWEAI
jgi:hypothetical protein